jgi:hypothetical protein
MGTGQHVLKAPRPPSPAEVVGIDIDGLIAKVDEIRPELGREPVNYA